jgi:pimeloyl-ACP methyl ester carboxylesterase
MFQHLYRFETVGVVLIDSAHPDQDRRFPAGVTTALAAYQDSLRRAKFLMPFGIPRLLRQCGEGIAELQPELRANGCRTAAIRETLAESLAFAQSEAEVNSAGGMGNLPLMVISEDPEKIPEEYAGPFESMQADLAKLSSRSTRVIAKGSGHQIHLERPDVVVSAIAALVEEARGNRDNATPH